MIDLSGIEWNWGVSAIWFIVPVIILLILILFAVVAEAEILWGILIILLFGWLILGSVLIWGAIPAGGVEKMEKEMTVAQLEEQGFERIELTGSKGFIASKDGDYFLGTLYPLGDHKYKVIEVPNE